MSAVADFRSDTVTRPTAGMLQAMVAAELGDDVLDGDPTVRALERWVADWLGKREALFVPSGTMANQVAIGSWTRPGDEVVAEASAHVVCWEAGALGANHHVQAQTLTAPGGAFDPEALERAIRPASIHCPRTALIALEQTFMGAGHGPGGLVSTVEELEAVRAVAERHSIPVHLDGARLANAVVASGVPARRFGELADSVSICLSKGLGAPVGSLVAASDPGFLERAAWQRKRLGGWMRQAGLLAAAGLFALETQLEDLARDHELAKDLARVWNRFPGLRADEPQTNIVMAFLDAPVGAAEESALRDANSLMTALAEHGVAVLPMHERCLRFVTHRDVGVEHLERLESALGVLFGEPAP